ncbi:hypothetical protein TspCOW1_17700 [Thiohalobacter sp. COW1]|uniref:RHS repeat-associated core domain-containing protein n=1 Tax=Thiohalobacter sp. COW1 TaxID=2795687 RepID=UPI001916368D|nr:RHS repeat-associated core domain-containing protein [Thiohalobacter sp. COW1]BCO31667.1 hypothetical protein TspCOW1_17700 [Thiohalobacter sp. COW1]
MITDWAGRATEYVYDPVSLAAGETLLGYNAQRTRLQSAGSDSFSYDAEGQLTDRSGTTLAFDPAHRLVGLGTETAFHYDGAGNRLAATREGATTQYIHDAAGNLIAEADAGGTITRHYVHGQGLIALIEGNTAYTYHFDALGSTVALTDADEQIVNAYSYRPYGRVVERSEAIDQPFTYVGQYGVMEEAAGLYYMRARYYDAEVGRFISEDPIGFEGGLNLYAYVGGNPIIGVDPEGTYCVPCAVWAGRAVMTAGRAAAPHIGRALGSAWQAAKTFAYTNPVTTTMLSNPVTHENAIDFVVGVSTEGPPPPTPGGYAGAFVSIGTKSLLDAVSGESASEATSDRPAPVMNKPANLNSYK